MDEHLDLQQLEGITYEHLQKMNFWNYLILPILIGSGYKIVKIDDDEEELE